MVKSKRNQKPKPAGGYKTKPKKAVVGKSTKTKSRAGSKQEKVLGLLKRSEGATVAAIMKAPPPTLHASPDCELIGVCCR
jgi:hypothetical protein